MKKRFLQFSFIAVLALFITMVSLQGISITASTDGEIDGELTSSNYNNRASVTGFTLLDSEGQVNDAEVLNPNTSVTAQVTISDPDSIADLNSVKFYFYYDETSHTTAGGLNLNLSAVTDATGSQFVAEWTRDSEAISVVSGGATFTWLLNSFTAPSITADYEGTDFTFEINFRISKVAPFTQVDDWFFGTVINDGRESLDSTSDPLDVIDKALLIGTGSTEGDPSSFDMAFYGEIDLSQTNISWSGVRAGDDFSNTPTSSAVLSQTKYISNNNFQTNIKSSEVWNAVITEEKVIEVLSGTAVDGDSTAITNFISQYNSSFNPDLNDSGSGSINDLIGATYADANTVINAISGTSVSWASIQFLLPQPSDDANLVGATLITAANVIDESGFTEQFFMIGYDDQDLSLSNEIDVGGNDYGLLGTGTDWRRFLPDSNNSQSATEENGVTNDLTLYLYLSSVFQNAQYSGTISLQITNTAP